MAVETGTRQFAAGVVGFMFAQFVGSSAGTIAEAFLVVNNAIFGDGGLPEEAQVAEAAFHVIYVAAGLGVCLGAVAVTRTWVNLEQVLIFVATAGIVALLAIVEYNLPSSSAEQRLSVGKSFYYLGWVAGLWFGPFLLLTAWTRDSANGLRMAGGLLIVTAAMAMVGLLAGICVEVLIKVIDQVDGRYHGWLGIHDNQRFWVARPVTMNTLGAAYVAVTFSTIWWPGLWRDLRMERLWPGCVSVATIAYGGLFGAVFYENGAWVSPVGGFFAFGALPGVVGLTVFVAYRLARQGVGGNGVRWPVSGLFWRLLPAGFALGLGAVALLGLAPLGRQPVADAPVVVLVVCHGLNGVFLGAALWTMPYAFGLMPDVERS